MGLVRASLTNIVTAILVAGGAITLKQHKQKENMHTHTSRLGSSCGWDNF